TPKKSSGCSAEGSDGTKSYPLLCAEQPAPGHNGKDRRMERKISSKPVDVTKLSPMMRQYWKVKEQYLEQLLFFRLGDFYELFFDDALIASRELELTLTGKECGLEERAPMCGIPYHSSENYIAKLVKKGYKVAI